MKGTHKASAKPVRIGAKEVTEDPHGLKRGNSRDIKDDPRQRMPAPNRKKSTANQYDSLHDGTTDVKRGYPERSEASYEETRPQGRDSAKTEKIRQK